MGVEIGHRIVNRKCYVTSSVTLTKRKQTCVKTFKLHPYPEPLLLCLRLTKGGALSLSLARTQIPSAPREGPSYNLSTFLSRRNPFRWRSPSSSSSSVAGNASKSNFPLSSTHTLPHTHVCGAVSCTIMAATIIVIEVRRHRDHRRMAASKQKQHIRSGFGCVGALRAPIKAGLDAGWSGALSSFPDPPSHGLLRYAIIDGEAHRRPGKICRPR